MRSRILILVITVFASNASFGQLPRKALNLLGTWEYKEGSGYETWEQNADELIGHAYRVNKVGDTSKVEDLSLKMVNKSMIHHLTTYQVLSDTTNVTTNRFLGGKRKLNFVNLDTNVPYSISYKLGFLNKNKLQIRIKYGIHEKPVKLILKRVKD